MAERPGRVVLFSPDWPEGRAPNGIVAYTAAMRRGLGERGVECVIVSSDIEASDCGPGVYDSSDARSEASAIERLAVAVMRRIDPADAAIRRAVPAIRRTLARVWADGPFDVFEAEDSFGLARAGLAHAGFPTVVRLHGPWFLNGRALGVREDRSFVRRDRDEGRCLAEAHAVSAPSQEVLDRVREHFGLALPSARVIPNPVGQPEPAQRWQASGCEPDTILFVGRFDRHKGGDVAIDAFARLASSHPAARLVIAGPDRGLRDEAGRTWSLDDYLAERIPDAAVRSRVMALGTIDPAEIAVWRRRAAVTIVPSRYEVFAMAALEAIAAGSPVIAARSGGLPEIVRDGETGRLFEPGDPEDLANVLSSLLSSPDQAARFAEAAARDCAERFSVASVADLTLDFYSEVMERFRATPSRKG